MNKLETFIPMNCDKIRWRIFSLLLLHITIHCDSNSIFLFRNFSDLDFSFPYMMRCDARASCLSFICRTHLVAHFFAVIFISISYALIVYLAYTINLIIIDPQCYRLLAVCCCFQKLLYFYKKTRFTHFYKEKKTFCLHIFYTLS